MRKHQLDDAMRGVDLLLAHLKGTPGDFVATMTSGDVEGARACADPLLTVATILTRMLRDSKQMTTEAAQKFIHDRVFDDDLSDDTETMRDLENVERIISTIIAARKPPLITTDPLMVSLLSQAISAVAAKEIANEIGNHENAVVAALRVKLKDQGEEVQLSDGHAARAVTHENAHNPEMRQSRQSTTYAIVNMWNDASNVLHSQSQNVALAADHRTSLHGVVSLGFTCAALSAGIYQLVSQANLYPAAALLRQIVEVEFVMWKFAQSHEQSQLWVESTADERRLSWRPSTIYRDHNNAYRQKDYSNHCELCGHPTPVGARVAAGLETTTIEANVLADLIGHCSDAWQHLITAVKVLDSEYSTDVSADIKALDEKFKSVMDQHSSKDHYSMSTAFFSDPID